MNGKKNNRKRIGIYAGLIGGTLADGLLRLLTGDEGNLLVHSAVFLVSFLIAAGVAYGLAFLTEKTGR